MARSAVIGLGGGLRASILGESAALTAGGGRDPGPVRNLILGDGERREM
jgi:hypothetical protein